MPESGEAVVEFGPGDDAQDPPGRRMPVGAFLTGLAGDRRLVPLAAVLGGVALFGSLISEWQITEVDGALWGDSETAARPLETNLADLGSWGGGYLTGLFLLVIAVVLTLFGPPAGRRYARLSALSVGGVLLAIVAALTSYLGDSSRVLGELNAAGLEDGQIAISHGRGGWCAAVGVALVLLAMILAGRHEVAVPAQVDAAGEAEPSAAADAAVWSWRRPTAAEEEDGPPDAPFGLTVTSAKPFTTSPENVDKPS
ncbi:hypothetical protein DMB66_43665 [Actinoplanes sp. ATCC 53533]|uniref:hypothetical protein n=1 Tax=Actinoplanes sp. ATCC 53533 TaxID=1288362 RepID=UPI000F79B2C5|nr:hypothetical protein [Actinoplanes sp. ATCC 53533]RSM50379.1 hypothetical protein DMB66_43665 [Actinoplanes sp. ATCC 53533]